MVRLLLLAVTMVGACDRGAWSAPAVARRYVDALNLGDQQRLDALLATDDVLRGTIACESSAEHPADRVAATHRTHLDRLSTLRGPGWDFTSGELGADHAPAGCAPGEHALLKKLTVKMKHVKSGKTEELQLTVLSVDDRWYLYD